jgi:hypothetical protein
MEEEKNLSQRVGQDGWRKAGVSLMDHPNLQWMHQEKFLFNLHLRETLNCMEKNFALRKLHPKKIQTKTYKTIQGDHRSKAVNGWRASFLFKMQLKQWQTLA